MSHLQIPSIKNEDNLQLLKRRGVIGSMGFVGLGLLATSTPASAFLFQKKSNTPKIVVVKGKGNDAIKAAGVKTDICIDSLPDEWVERHGSLITDYDRYLASLNLKRLSAHQVVEAHAKCRNGVWNTLPPKQWWTRMGYTLRVIDRVAVELDMPVKEVVSAYRCPAYNARCPGAKKGSWHQANVAVDVQFPVRPSMVTAAARSLRDRGLFKGGIGSYPTFTHIDTRGTNTNW